MGTDDVEMSQYSFLDQLFDRNDDDVEMSQYPLPVQLDRNADDGLGVKNSVDVNASLPPIRLPPMDLPPPTPVSHPPRQQIIGTSLATFGLGFPPPGEQRISSAGWSPGCLACPQEGTHCAHGRGDASFSGYSGDRTPAARPLTSYAGNISQQSPSIPNYPQHSAQPFPSYAKPSGGYSAPVSGIACSQPEPSSSSGYLQHSTQSPPPFNNTGSPRNVSTGGGGAVHSHRKSSSFPDLHQPSNQPVSADARPRGDSGSIRSGPAHSRSGVRTVHSHRQSSSFPDLHQPSAQPLSSHTRPVRNSSTIKKRKIYARQQTPITRPRPPSPLHDSNQEQTSRRQIEVIDLTQDTEEDFPSHSLPSQMQTMPESGSIHTPLNKEGEYRILVLKPGIKDQIIECSLVKSSDFNGEYEALSYVRMDQQLSREIQIVPPDPRASGQSSGEKFYVTPNLCEIILHLRHPTEIKCLWIDSICIDQQNPKEKNQQVNIIAEIYRRAKSVLVFLGPQDSKFDTAMEFLWSLRTLDATELDRLISDNQQLDKWGAVATVIGHQYFRQLWAIQEIGFAKKVYLISGRTKFDWQLFVDMVLVFVKHCEDKRRVWHRLGAYHLIETVNKIFYKSDDGLIRRRKWSLNALVLQLKGFYCSDPRDIIYAVLSMAKEKEVEAGLMSPCGRSQLRLPDYEAYVAEVFAEFVESFFKSTKSIDIICQQWATGDRGYAVSGLNNGPPFPSWILTRPELTCGEHDNQSASSNNSLVGADLTQPVYNAASGRKGDAEFGRVTREGKLQLNMTAKGVRLAVIGTLGDRVLQGIISGESLKMGGWSPAEYGQSQPQDIPPRLWRTMVADRSPEGQTVSKYRSACISAFQCLSPSGDLDTQKVMGKKVKKNEPNPMLDFLKRVRSVVWNRKFFLTKLADGPCPEEELFGIGPKGTQQGDIICILFGCTVPVVLRECRAQGTAHFEFIGDAYVHGMMEGEAFRYKDPQDVELWTERFELY